MNTKPSSKRQRAPVQISLAMILFLTLLFALMATSIGLAFRVPAIQEELAILMGREVGSVQNTSRFSHMVFIMFTLTSPLILAILLSAGVSTLRRIVHALS